MTDNGNHPGVRVAETRPRFGSGPLLILAFLFVAATFLAWYFTWFGRGLSDNDIAKYLSDEQSPRHVQHALLQIQQRIERNDPSAKKWYPQVVKLSSSKETEYRLTVAWLMGFDNSAKEFHEALLQLVHDSEPIVRRNAALALVRFNDSTGREQLLEILKPYQVVAPVAGQVESTLHEGSSVSRGTLLARIQAADGRTYELRSPLAGRLQTIERTNGSQVSEGDGLLLLNSDEESVWEALRGLMLIGEAGDLDLIRSYENDTRNPERVRQQAKFAEAAIGERKGK